MSASTQALEKASNGDAQGGIDILSYQLSILPQTKANDTYHAFLHFNLGFIYTNYGFNVNEDYLSIAAFHYKKSLDYQPGDEKILNNLILIYNQKRQYDSSLFFLKKIIKRDPQHEGVYLIAMGDVYNSLGRIEEATKSYQKAITFKDQTSLAGRKLIDMYTHYPNSYFDQLYQQCIEFEQTLYPQLAKPGYENLLSRQHEALSPEHEKLMEEVLLRWVATSIKLKYITPDLFTNSGMDTVTFAPISELNKIHTAWVMHKDPGSILNDLIWWKGNSRRYYYFLAFEKTYADFEMNYGDPKYAIYLYEQVLGKLWDANDYSEMIYGQEDVLITDVVILLARIYNSHEFKQETKWKNLENHILEEKGNAYRTNNLANRQKFHTILGQLYMERGEYSGNTYRNAKFQLNNAINVAQRRADQDPNTYYPIPQLYQLLATLYDTLGEKKNAYEAYVNAALGYLESDNLRSAGTMVQRASARDVQNQFNTKKLSAVQTIYNARLMIPLLDRARFDENQNKYFLEDNSYSWLSDASIEEEIPENIVESQRFKVLSDLSIRAGEVDAQDASAKLSGDARDKAKKIKVMSSGKDAIRLHDINTEKKGAGVKGHH